MSLNRTIVVVTLVITGVGMRATVLAAPGKSGFNQDPTAVLRVLMGGWVFMVILSIVDLFGGVGATLASGLALVVLVYVLLNSGALTSLLSTIAPAPAQAVPGGNFHTNQA